MKEDSSVKTVFVVVLALLAIAFLTSRIWLGKLAFGIGVAALIFPPLCAILAKGWMGFARAIGWINSRLLLLIVFYIILFPVSLVARFFVRRDFLQLRNKKTASTFKNCDHLYVKADLENIW